MLALLIDDDELERLKDLAEYIRAKIEHERSPLFSPSR